MTLIPLLQYCMCLEQPFFFFKHIKDFSTFNGGSVAVLPYDKR